MDSLRAELLLLRKRTALRTLLAAWSLMALLFSYLLPYYAFTSRISLPQGADEIILSAFLPQNFVTNFLAGFPFFGGVYALILGVLAMGSEFSWGTLTTVFTQRAGRLKIFFAKMLALLLALIPFVLSIFLLALAASSLIAWREGEPIDLPPVLAMVKALGASWFILTVWASFGVLLAVLSRGTALAIGLGIIYGLVLENIVAGFGRQIELLGQISQALLRTGGYSLTAALGTSTQIQAGPGSFAGPFLSGQTALLLLAGYIVLFILTAAAILYRRDVAG